MKQWLLAVLSVAVFGSCVSTKKYADFVDKGYKRSDTTVVQPMNGIRIIPGTAWSSDSTARVRKDESYFIPALFYWGVKQSFICDLNPRIPMRIFSNTCYRYADSVGLPKTLGGKRLEITVDSIPGQFEYMQKEDVIFIIVFYFTTTNQSIYPGNNKLYVSYKLYDGNTVAKQGRVFANNNDRAYTDNRRSTKKVTWAYLAQYEQNIKKMSSQCMSRIMNEIK